MNNYEIKYLELMYKKSISALKNFIVEENETAYIHTSQNRAEFNRLRLEITKELLRLENKMYKRK